MPKRTSQRVPKGAEVIRSYADFYGEMDAFGHGERNMLIVVGPPGTSKSTAAREHLKNARVIQGGSTPYRLYQELYENRDLPVVLDDADRVFKDKRGVFLLKLLAQTDPTRVIQWNSNTAEIRSGDLPAEFTTTSRVLIVANSWPQDDPDIASIESRGYLVYFDPPPKEMHQFAGGFCDDPEVYEFIGGHIDHFDRLDLRLYFKACQFKATGIRRGDAGVWKRYVRGQMMDDERRVALDLKNDPSLASDNQRAREYRRITGRSERTFYRHLLDIRLRSGEV